MASAARKVDDLLGLTGIGAGSPLALAQSIEQGLPVAAVDRLARTVAPHDRGFKFRIVPKATLERRRRSRRLSNEEGNRIARVAKAWGMAMSVYRDEAKAQEFLTRPHAMLEGRTPLDVALATGPGADAVVNLLGRAAYGAAV